MCYGQESFERVFCSLRRRNVELNLLCSRAESLLSYQFSSATISQLQSLLRRICLSIQSILSLIFDKQSYLWLLAASPVNFAHEAVSLGKLGESSPLKPVLYYLSLYTCLYTLSTSFIEFA